ncbi:MAG: hypothetical protein VKO44_09300, partial [Cyanobacteriota bacterium]|nr:hypothetical protein [Cyanobacteriota bacterium]
GATLAIGGDGRITAETTGSGAGGKVVLKGQPLTLANGTIVSTATSGHGANAGAGGQLTVQTAMLDINAATLTTASKGAGQAGQLIIVPEGNGPFVARFSNMSQITAATADLFGGRGGSILLDGGSRDVLLQGLGLVTVQSNGSGHAGTITLRGRTLTLDDQALLSAQTTGSGRGGSIDINADTIILDDGARITTSSNGLNQQATGPAGSIFLTAHGPNSLHLRNGSEIDSFTSSSNPYTNDAELAHIFITTPNLTLSGNSRVNAMTTGAAKGGSIVLNTPSISLTRGSTITSETRGSGSGGQIRLDDPASPLRLSGGGTLTTATSGPGHGGDILVHTRRGTLDQGVTLTAATTGSGAGGTITVLSQQPLALRDGSTISARSTGGAGRAGDITIRTSELNLQDRSAILADGRDNGQAGNIRLTVDNDLRLANRSSINATTSRSGSSDTDNANIRIKVGGNLLLNNGSRIEASATGIANGGNLFLDISNGFLFASFPPSSPGGDVLASAERGSGGRIEVRALGLFGVNFNTFNTPISEVSAKSTAGRDGVVAIYNPYLTPDRGLIPIEQPIDVSNDVVRACAPRADGRRAEFTLSGRGGLPVQPGEVPTASPLLDDLGRPATSPAATSSQPPALRSLLSAQPPSTGDVPPTLAPQVLLPPCPEPR